MEIKPGDGYDTNWCIHYDAKLITLEDGSLAVFMTKRDRTSRNYKEYLPVGNSFSFPVNWGEKKGATLFLESKIADTTKTLESAKRQLEKLTECLTDVNNWKE